MLQERDLRPARTLPAVIDELSTGRPGQPKVRARVLALLQEPAILQDARDVLLGALPPDLLAPFAPVIVRRPAVVNALRAAIAAGVGALRHVPPDGDVLYELYAATVGWGPAQRYLDDPLVNEVKLVGCVIRVQEQGQGFVTVPERFGSADEVLSRVQLLASALGVVLDGTTPQQTLPVSEGTRMHATIPPRVLPGDVLVCIRRGRTAPWRLADLLRRGTLDAAVADLLLALCQARCSFLIVGPTGAGKTALLEVLANSWSGDPHTVSIEDHTLEIVIDPARIWTRELVDTYRDPEAFGRVAREALRQTPDLLLPGEVRGSEAGAILALIMSDHSVITTVHARSATEGLKRFARCAALPGSYMYANRFADALDDAANGFDVVVKVEFWAATGRRVITEIALAAGVTLQDGQVRAVTVPLVTLDIGEDGALGWQHHASIETGELIADRAVLPLPPALREKLRRAAQSQANQDVAVAAVAAALERAAAFTGAGDGTRAVVALRDAWRRRHDARLLQAAQAACALLPASDVAAVTESAVIDDLAAALRERDWDTAANRLEAILDDVMLAALWLPATGWQPVARAIAQGQDAEQVARAALVAADQLLRSGAARLALTRLEQINVGLLGGPLTAAVAAMRRDSLRDLVATGDAAPAALAAAEARVGPSPMEVNERSRGAHADESANLP